MPVTWYVSLPVSRRLCAFWPSSNCNGNSPMPTRLVRWMRSKLSAITAFTPSSITPLAAQSRDDPEPYSFPARISNIEARAGEMRQKLIKEFAHEGQGARMVGRQGCWVAHISAARAFVGLGDLSQLLQRRIFQPITQMPERVLVRHQVNPQRPAPRGQLQYLLACKRPAATLHKFELPRK